MWDSTTKRSGSMQTMLNDGIPQDVFFSQALCRCLLQVFIGKLMLDPDSDAPGGVNLKVVQTPVMAAAHEEALLASREQHYFKTVHGKN